MSFERGHEEQDILAMQTPTVGQTAISGATPSGVQDMSVVHRSSIASISSSKGTHNNKRILKMSLVRNNK